jgi:hypothetical protein
MSTGLTVTKNIHFSMADKGRREMRPGPAPVRDSPEGRVPRVARLMALAIKFESLLAAGAVRDQAELAELGHVTRARVTQIMNLLHLAPDIQEAILYLPRSTRGRDPITERDVRALAAETDWRKQRRLWRALAASSMSR